MSKTVIAMKRKATPQEAAKLDKVLDRLNFYKKKAKLYDKLVASQRRKKKAKKKKRAARSR